MVEKGLSVVGQAIGILLTGITALLLFVFLAAFLGCTPSKTKQYRVGTPSGNYCVFAKGWHRTEGCTVFKGTSAVFCGQVAVVEVPKNTECPTYFPVITAESN